MKRDMTAISPVITGQTRSQAGLDQILGQDKKARYGAKPGLPLLALGRCYSAFLEVGIGVQWPLGSRPWKTGAERTVIRFNRSRLGNSAVTPDSAARSSAPSSGTG